MAGAVLAGAAEGCESRCARHSVFATVVVLSHSKHSPCGSEFIREAGGMNDEFASNVPDPFANEFTPTGFGDSVGFASVPVDRGRDFVPVMALRFFG